MPSYADIKQIILNRRSVRRFLPDPVPEGDILEMLECARWAPSDTNQQPWRFIVITNPKTIATIEDICWQAISHLRERAAGNGHPEAAKKMKVFGKYAVAFSGAPVLIILTGEPYRSRFTEEIFRPVLSESEMAVISQEESIKSVCLAGQNLLLAAHALGYGTCAMTGPVILAEREIAALIGLPPEHFIVMAVAVGRPDQKPEGPGRRPLTDSLTWLR